MVPRTAGGHLMPWCHRPQRCRRPWRPGPRTSTTRAEARAAPGPRTPRPAPAAPPASASALGPSRVSHCQSLLAFAAQETAHRFRETLVAPTVVSSCRRHGACWRHGKGIQVTNVGSSTDPRSPPVLAAPDFSRSITQTCRSLPGRNTSGSGQLKAAVCSAPWGTHTAVPRGSVRRPASTTSRCRLQRIWPTATGGYSRSVSCAHSSGMVPLALVDQQVTVTLPKAWEFAPQMIWCWAIWLCSLVTQAE